MRHSFVFTFRLEPQVIRIKESGANAVRENCIRCHSFQVQKANALMDPNSGRQCWDCHRETPHGRGNSLSSTPMARL
jgi:cytochrome c nitrite reductase small subunit